ncbi:hypothetical protein V2I01_10540 [Micromonospora sp. BRA006-A]|nr:hypothetical protein [Micromonospora sp. BRA006-A]
MRLTRRSSRPIESRRSCWRSWTELPTRLATRTVSAVSAACRAAVPVDHDRYGEADHAEQRNDHQQGELAPDA